MCVCVLVCLSVCVYMSFCVCVCVCLSVCMYLRVSVCLSVCLYLPVCLSVYVCALTHDHTQLLKLVAEDQTQVLLFLHQALCPPNHLPGPSSFFCWVIIICQKDLMTSC